MLHQIRLESATDRANKLEGEPVSFQRLEMELIGASNARALAPADPICRTTGEAIEMQR